MLRRISTARLIVTVFAVVAFIAAVTAVTALALDGNGPRPPARGLAAAIHDALAGGPVSGMSADITFTDRLIGSTSTGAGAGTGVGASSPLLTGASGRLWVSADGQARLELQSSRGDTEISLSRDAVTLYDVATNTLYEWALPTATASGATGASGSQPDQLPTVATIESALEKLMGTADLSGAEPTNIGSAPAYSVTISPKHPAGLLGEARLGWDAMHGMPLDVAIYASGDSTPVLELKVTSVSFGRVSPSVFAITPPASARVVRIAPPATPGAGSGSPGRIVDATGVAAVSAALPFTLDAPATLAGLSRGRVTLIGLNGKHAAVALYGDGLGSIAVVELQADSTQHASGGIVGALGSLPRVQVNGVSGSELATALGTAVEFTRDGIDYVVAGFVAPAAVEAVARGL
jgi:outer membrane lipoprotein-sorting protein